MYFYPVFLLLLGYCNQPLWGINKVVSYRIIRMRAKYPSKHDRLVISRNTLPCSKINKQHVLWSDGKDITSMHHTLKTWKASNWILRLLSLNKFIISLRFSARLMYLVITVKLCLSRRSSPRSWRKIIVAEHWAQPKEFLALNWWQIHLFCSRVQIIISLPSKTDVWWHSCQNAGAFRIL